MATPTIDAIADADLRIRPYAIETPLLEWSALNEKLEARILCKAEPLQRTGSFKFRGAYNRVSRIDRAAFPGGVVACSSGNHAQGVAEAARLCGVDAVIVMPSDAPKVKIARTSHCGAEIVFYDRDTEDRNAIARDLCERLNADFVPPFDDPMVIAGQGTVGLEIARQSKVAAGIDAVLVPISGGGLTAGVAIAVKDRFPDAEIYCVEPKGFDDYRRSLSSGDTAEKRPCKPLDLRRSSAAGARRTDIRHQQGFAGWRPHRQRQRCSLRRGLCLARDEACCRTRRRYSACGSALRRL